MSFTRANPLGWGLYEQLTSTQMNHVDLNQSRALDGFAGGTYNPTGDLLINGRLGGDPVRVIPRAAAPPSPAEADIWAESGSPYKRQVRVNGAWRTIAEEPLERQFKYPLSAASAHQQGSGTQADWEWDDNYFWFNPGPSSGGYLQLGLNRFVPQNATITQISTYWQPGNTDATESDRMQCRLYRKDPTSTRQLLLTYWANNVTTPHWKDSGAISHVCDTNTYMWWVEVRGGLYVGVDYLLGLEIKFKDTGVYMRTP